MTLNLKQLCEYLRIHVVTFRRNLYNGEYADVPKRTKSVVYLDRKGKKKVRMEYEFDLKKVLDYFEKKYHDIKRP